MRSLKQAQPKQTGSQNPDEKCSVLKKQIIDQIRAKIQVYETRILKHIANKASKKDKYHHNNHPQKKPLSNKSKELPKHNSVVLATAAIQHNNQEYHLGNAGGLSLSLEISKKIYQSTDESNRYNQHKKSVPQHDRNSNILSHHQLSVLSTTAHEQKKMMRPLDHNKQVSSFLVGKQGQLQSKQLRPKDIRQLLGKKKKKRVIKSSNLVDNTSRNKKKQLISTQDNRHHYIRLIENTVLKMPTSNNNTLFTNSSCSQEPRQFHKKANLLHYWTRSQNNQPGQRLRSEEDDLVSMVKELQSSSIMPPTPVPDKKTLQGKVVQIQRAWRLYKTKKLIRMYQDLLSPQGTRTSSNYFYEGEEEHQQQYQESIIMEVAAANQGQEQRSYVVSDKTQEISQVKLEDNLELEKNLYQQKNSVKMPAEIDQIKEVGAEKESIESPASLTSPRKSDSGIQDQDSCEKIVYYAEASDDGAENSEPQNSIINNLDSIKSLENDKDFPSFLDPKSRRETHSSVEDQDKRMTAWVHPIEVLRFRQLDHLAQLRLASIKSHYDDERRLIDDEFDIGILDQAEYQNQIRILDRWHAQQSIQVERYQREVILLGNTTKKMILELTRRPSIGSKGTRQRDTTKFLGNSTSDSFLLGYSKKAMRNLETRISLSCQSKIMKQKEQSLTGSRINITLPDKTLRAQAVQDIFQSLITEVFQEIKHSAIISAQLRQIKNKCTKGIKTDRYIIRMFSKKLVEHCFDFQSTYRMGIFDKLMIPLGRGTTQEVLNIHHNLDPSYNNSEYDTIDEIIPIEIFETFNQTIIQGLQFKPYFINCPELENPRIDMLRDCINYHNTAIYHALNQALNEQRRFGMLGQPYPWKPSPVSGYFEDVDSAVDRARERVVFWHETACGTISEKLLLHNPQFKNNEKYVQVLREERLSRMLAEELLEQMAMWNNYDLEESLLLLEMGDLIFQSIIKQECRTIRDQLSK